MAIAFLHCDGMSPLLGGSVSCRISLACGMGLFSGGGGGRLGCCWCLSSPRRWAEFLNLARRCICLVFAFVIRGRSFLGSVEDVCSVIGHTVCACLWYVSTMFMTCFAALSMCVGVMAFEVAKSCM